MHQHAKLIKALGGSTALAKIIETNSTQVVNQWRSRGIPVKYWPTIARLCDEREIRIPRDIKEFLE